MQIVQDQSRELDLLTQRRIPVVWFGIAQQVRLMGSFDNWTQGFGLSAQEFSDDTFTRFQATLTIVPVIALSSSSAESPFIVGSACSEGSQSQPLYLHYSSVSYPLYRILLPA